MNVVLKGAMTMGIIAVWFLLVNYIIYRARSRAIKNIYGHNPYNDKGNYETIGQAIDEHFNQVA